LARARRCSRSSRWFDPSPRPTPPC
jgi:hypothetical protein